MYYVYQKHERGIVSGTRSRGERHTASPAPRARLYIPSSPIDVRAAHTRTQAHEHVHEGKPAVAATARVGTMAAPVLHRTPPQRFI